MALNHPKVVAQRGRRTFFEKKRKKHQEKENNILCIGFKHSVDKPAMASKDKRIKQGCAKPQKSVKATCNSLSTDSLFCLEFVRKLRKINVYKQTNTRQILSIKKGVCVSERINRSPNDP